MATFKYKTGGIKIPIDGQATIEVSRVRRARLTGFLFETAKTFLLPSALSGIRELVRFCKDHPRLLVSGHTDTVGAAEYNRGLSVERADSLKAYLQDDVERWMSWYSGGPCSNAWGTREDQYMLSSVGFPCAVTGTLDPPTQQAVRGYQEKKGLVVDGQPGPVTRRALVRDYMSADGTTLPASCALETHGCGETHPDVPTGDEVDEQRNRRVEIFLFEGDVDPPARTPCPAGGCPEYPIWVRRSIDTADFGGEPGTLTVTVKDKRGNPVGDAEVELRGMVADDGKTGGDGTRRIADLPPGSYTLIARQGGFASDSIVVDVPSGESEKTVELADVALLVTREGEDPESARDRIECAEGDSLFLHWRVRGAEPTKVEIGNDTVGKKGDVTHRGIKEGAMVVGFIPLTVEKKQHAGGTARYKLDVDGGHPPRDVTVTVGPPGPVPEGRRVVFAASEMEEAVDLGFVRVRYRKENT